jgi:hypothetical protein
MVVENMAHEIKLSADEIDASEVKDSAFRIELSARKGNLAEAIILIKKLKFNIKIYRDLIH